MIGSRPRSSLVHVRNVWAAPVVLGLVLSTAAVADAVAPVWQVNHPVGVIGHGIVTQGSGGQAWTDHPHARKNVDLWHEHSSGSWYNHCAASGTGTTVSCGSTDPGRYQAFHSVSPEVPVPPPCSGDSASVRLLDGHGMCPHWGSIGLVRDLTHIPAPSLVAGDDAALVVDASWQCSAPCDYETAVLYYETSAGWQSASPTETTGTSYSFSVPGNAVRYPQLNYYFEFERCYVGGGCDSVSLPTQPGSFHEVTVTNRLTITFGEPGGPMLSTAPYQLRLLRPGQTSVTIATGSSDSQGVATMTIPDTEVVLAEAAANDGFVNLELVASKAGGCIDPVMVPVNFGNPLAHTFPGIGPGVPSASPVSLQCTEPCQHPYGQHESIERVPSETGTKLGRYHALNAAYGSRQEIDHSKRTLSQFSIGYKIASGDWKGTEAKAVIANESEGSGWSKCVPDTPGDPCSFRNSKNTLNAKVRASLRGTKTRAEWRAEDTPEQDDCYVNERLVWDTHINSGGQDVVDEQINWGYNDCQTGPNTSNPCDSDNLDYVGRCLGVCHAFFESGGGGGIQAAICYVGICVNGGMTRSTNTIVHIYTDGRCDVTWYYAGHDTESPRLLNRAKQFWMDAGEKGNALDPQTGVPLGCDP